MEVPKSNRIIFIASFLTLIAEGVGFAFAPAFSATGERNSALQKRTLARSPAAASLVLV